MKNSIIYQRRPASYQSDRWKDATPLGNGETGALVFGDVQTEHVRFTRSDVWSEGRDPVPPDVGYTLKAVRGLMDEGKYYEADTLLHDELVKANYQPALSSPIPICDLDLSIVGATEIFYDYRRAIDLDKAMSIVSYRIGDSFIERSSFVSRCDGCFYLRITSDKPITCLLSLAIPNVDAYRNDECTEKNIGSALVFERKYRQSVCGAAVRVVETDGTTKVSDTAITVSGLVAATIVVKTFSDIDDIPNDVFGESFDSAYRKNLATYRKLYSRADISFKAARNQSNEELLLNAFSEGASPELLEKLWRFGRYLFISGTQKDGLPFPLYGLWTGDYDLMWSQHVSNENVQIIYWHVLCGAMSELVKPLIDYFYSKIAQFRDNAKKLFGCRGIVVSAYTTPFNSHMAPPVPVILNFTTASGWLCRHFFDYYDYTHDEKTLTEKILPFALETAEFFEDFAVIRDGKLLWYPSVSPENTPQGFTIFENAMAHGMPTTKNATMELAIIKETLSRLCGICSAHSLCADKLPVWKKIIDAIPQYAVNSDGAVKEWQTPEFSDFYCHRHMSHIYPVFPGNEVTEQSDKKLYRAFERAVDLRELGGQSGWSLSHMAGIYARFGRGNDVISCLDVLCRAVLTENFFTLHNDWRSNGLTLKMKKPPIQLDALMGVVNAVQQSICDWDGHTLHLLHAIPDRLPFGKAKGLAFPNGKVNMEWDKRHSVFKAVVKAVSDIDILVSYPDFVTGKEEKIKLSAKAGESVVIGRR